jgi:7-carboxy-7-deazaguanine synthase
MFGEPGAYAIQGEGLFAGIPSVFVRTFGCNLRCKFGLTHDDDLAKSYEKQLRKFVRDFPEKTLNEMPVYDKYCDTYYSLFPEYRKFIKEYTVEEMFEALKIRTDDFNSDIHLVITGGEPLLPKHQLFWQQVFNLIDEYADNCVNITFETNGTYELITHFPDDKVIVNYSVSPKLKNSGQSYFKTIKPKVIESYINDTFGRTWFKFVGRDESIVNEIKNVIEIYGDVVCMISIYIMPEGGTKKEFDNNAEIIYKICSKNGWRYSPRHQVSVLNNLIGN